MKLPVAAIREDPAVQLRGGLDMDRIEAMAEFVEQGGTLPPITVVGDDNLLADGHHRLYLALTTGALDIEANRVPGGSTEAIALAIQLNDIATSLPLNKTQRNAGVKLLLAAGWSQERIATVTGVHRRTIGNIAYVLAARGQLPKAKKAAGTAGGAVPKPVAVLPKAVHEKLADTTILRIAEGVPVEQQVEFATAVAEVNLSEPRVREAAKALRADGKSPREAVESVTPIHIAKPRTLPDVAKQVRRRLEAFLNEPMTVEDQERDFWAVLDVLAANADLIPLEAGSLARLLADVSVRADHYSSLLRSAEAIEATA